ncbi:hypothetical protein [Aureibacter tunicatorum]|uniref:Holliday junction resolvase-like endonuclease n=1 Tax=Aureibacter tunicatorum TaxID=866807 RepID=A0AAE3XU04_9BACT|nr:hypothetical protein [Aureibacter tunicatorum]MDR6241669.1 putative Holliday junction resolvase-like endonuclease [Aureibacter tunicatorum]BDD07345.1 hypothetical protein AUTU_48280 [Aureibacter tunicatorum]
MLTDFLMLLDEYSLVIIVVLFIIVLALVAKIKQLNSRLLQIQASMETKKAKRAEAGLVKKDIDEKVAESNSRWQKKFNKTKAQLDVAEQKAQKQEKDLAKAHKQIEYYKSIIEDMEK